MLQRGKGGGLAGALGGMGGQSAFGTKAGDLFTKITVGVASFWIVISIVAAMYAPYLSGEQISPTQNTRQNAGQMPVPPPAGKPADGGAGKAEKGNAVKRKKGPGRRAKRRKVAREPRRNHRRKPPATPTPAPRPSSVTRGASTFGELLTCF